MSDEPVLAPAPAETPVDLTTKIEAPNVEVPPPEPAKDEPKPETGDLTTPEEVEEQTEGEKRNVPGSQKLKRRLALIEQEYAQKDRELEEYKRREREAEQRQQQQGRPGIDREPTEQDFAGDYLAYERAKIAWDVRQSVREEMKGAVDEGKAERDRRIQQEQFRERVLAYEENADAARERIPDFDKVVASATGVKLTPSVQEELLASDKSALLQYHLAKNPDKVRELNSMTPRELAREIGRLESRVHLPTAKKATEANPPPSEVKGAAAPPVDGRNGPDDMNAYVAWRRKQAS